MRRHAIIEGIVDTSVKLIQIHSLKAIFESLVLRLTPQDRLFLLTSLIGMARLERVAHPSQHFLIEMKPVEQSGKRLVQYLLPNIFAPTAGTAGVHGHRRW
ncbi:hypothetical protein [Mesorhizobium sp.]|uniref:hypothetical protein n=1 Tax=Mesorhizobium sp. TaxID=1871066 RepID=UPI000FE83ED6|nr:hypothetical protein [Mesorhizobium sp.]RWK37323.1 MAG: hypothetical protein EOR46_25975 [Mesorhizobium sp.]RWK66182.1 MAG: hypothetical protein EOR54_25740 [Mesorhizobium sp.]RWK73264.1 MAG: hypothetical protein EOR50_24775 [Mesorhizobium sp.]RWK75945.1 MAG: hypothetical protein EOR51_30210 [Mesorhizobium sp.]RWL00570.1 MAG: hypothetical protein EOR55_28355 [Mesorhizobium sp.]